VTCVAIIDGYFSLFHCTIHTMLWSFVWGSEQQNCNARHQSLLLSLLCSCLILTKTRQRSLWLFVWLHLISSCRCYVGNKRWIKVVVYGKAKKQTRQELLPLLKALNWIFLYCTATHTLAYILRISTNTPLHTCKELSQINFDTWTAVFLTRSWIARWPEKLAVWEEDSMTFSIEIRWCGDVSF